MVGIVLLGIFVLLLAFGAPIAVCLGMSSVGAILVQGAGKPLDAIMSVLPRLCSSASSKFVLLAIPFFMLAGTIMNAGGVATRIFDFCNTLVGHIPGGLGHVNVFCSVIFAGMSGSALADTGGIGAIELKAMKDQGFDDDFSAAITGASSCLGPIIPPSTGMVLYAMMAEESVGTLFIAGVLPGIIMAADNVLALFLLPFFGALSDRTSTKIGRRMPFILGGTAAAVILMNLLPLFDNGYANGASTGKLAMFVVTLGLLLVAMGTYRSPAVALMPDVTPKPIRSRANAIINLMGAVGGISYLIVAAVLYPNSKTAGAAHVNYQPLFVVVSVLMAVSVIVLYFTTDEPKLAAAEKEYEAEHPEQQLVEEEPDGSEELPKEVKRSLVMLLNSIALWYIGYNGVTTWWTTYVGRVMGQGLGGASTCLLVATGGAIVSYIPVGQLASKIGRKKTIQGGVILLAACFASAYFLTTHYQSINAVMFVVFALVGLAWAAINVNSLPMVVEMCKGSDIGKFTGYYYTFSMAAQVVTPILAGTLLKHISYSMLFPYAAFFVACSFVTMCFVRHGDCKVEAKAGLAAFEDMDAD